jgi:hypothetical protein
MTDESPEKMRARAEKNGYKNGTKYGSLLSQVKYGMLPTPTAFDYNSARTPQKWEEDKAKYKEKGINLQMPLKQMARLQMLPTPIAGDWKGQRRKDGTASMLSGKASLGMLPTPAARDWKGSRTKEKIEERKIQGKQTDEGTRPGKFAQYGKSSQLNPRFVMEMMGFPPDWTELPFLNGETNPSKQEETQ